jgi:hypothetical protein
MINPKEATTIAQQQSVEMLGQSGFDVEEIVRDEHKGREVWAVTLSFTRMPPLTDFARLTSSLLRYKRFLIDVDTGALMAIKRREPASR